MTELTKQIAAIAAERLKQLRLSTVDEQGRPLSRRQFAKRIGVSHATVANVESGAQHASLQFLYTVAFNMEVPLTQLLPAPDEVAESIPQPQYTDVLEEHLPEWRDLIVGK